MCDKIIDFFENQEILNKGQSRTKEGHLVTDTKYKDCWETILDQDKTLYDNYTKELQLCCNKYIEKFPFCNIYSEWRIIEPINIQKYDPGGAFFEFHTERIGSIGLQSSRHLVFMTYLNDVQGGGETEFPQQQVKIQPKKGLTLIWPADWTHTHRGIPTINKEKYIATGWFNYIN